MVNWAKRVHAVRRIIFPQAAVSALPNFTSVLIDLIKDTSLVYTITVIDLMAKANIAAAHGFILSKPIASCW